MKLRIIGGLLFVLMLAGCDGQALFEGFIPQQDAAFAKNHLALLQERNFDAVEAEIDPSIKNEQLRANLEHVASFFPSENPLDIDTVGVQTVSSSDRTQVSLTFQYVYPNKWLLANVVLRKSAEATVVAGIHVRPLSDSLQNINRFTLEGKGAVHYAIFLLAIAVPLFIVAVLFLCIKTPIPKRKWLWVIFILLGIAQVTLNWTDGSLNVTPISFQILGAGFWMGSLFAPLMLSVSIPLGALVFLFKRKSYLELNERERKDQLVESGEPS